MRILRKGWLPYIYYPDKVRSKTRKPMSSLRDRMQTYSTRAALYLRGREADALRGRPEQLHELELVTDLDLLKKHAWKLAIKSAIASFFVAPLCVMLLQTFLPAFLAHVLWFLVKLAMAGTGVLFALAAYYTFGPGSDSGAI